MKLISFFIYFLIFIITLTNANSQQIKIGSMAPPISIREVIDDNIDTSITFKDKIVILEFWATWCAPCIALIPHINSLVEKFAKTDVVFVSITSEERSVVEKFLTKNTIKSFVVLDKVGMSGFGITQLAFGVTAIPKTFIIDKQGLVQWYGNPIELSDNILDEYFKSGHIYFAEREKNDIDPFSSISKNSFYTLIINRSQTAGFMKDGLLMGSLIYRQNEDTTEIVYRSGSVVDFISKLFGQPITRIKIEGDPKIEPIDLMFRITEPLPDSILKDKIINAIETAFDMNLSYQYEMTKGWSIILIDPERLTPSASSKGTSYFPTESSWIGAGVSMSVFAMGLESNLNQYFFDETNLDGKYDFNVPTKSIDELQSVLTQNYGIELKESTRSIRKIRLTFK